MYNTIWVMILKITNAHIRFFKKGGFYSVSNENVTHVKILPYLSVVQSVEGSYDIALGKDEWKQTGEGGFFIASSGVQQSIVHHVNKKSGKMSCRWIFIDVEVNKAFPLDSLYQFPAIVNDERKNELNILFDRLFATNDIWENYCDCYKLLGYLTQMATPIKTEMHQGIQRTIAYITEHYTEHITVRKLASISSMSESNFYAVFKKKMGISPIAYLNSYRLSVAAERLTETSDTVSEISYSVGINDPLYFSKLFKKIYGTAPKEYRFAYQNKQNLSII